jgi:hypothetical protein
LPAQIISGIKNNVTTHLCTHGASRRLPEEEEYIQHAIGIDTVTMEIAGITTTTSSPYNISIQNLTHRLISTNQEISINFRIVPQRTSQIQELLKLRKIRNYMRVTTTYLQVPANTYNETLAGNTHPHTLVSQHICITNNNGVRQHRIIRASVNNDKGAERHIITVKWHIG